jgi:CheY-like chemotaxis protein
MSPRGASQMKDARILLVDDEVVFANNISKLLSRRGYEVKAVNSGMKPYGL